MSDNTYVPQTRVVEGWDKNAEMKSKIKTLNPDELTHWQEVVSDPKGETIDFLGVQCLDTDLAESIFPPV